MVVVLAAQAGCGNDGGAATASLPSEVDSETAPHTSLESLVEASPIVAVGRFVGPPEVVATQDEPDAGIARKVLVYEFEPSEILRDAFAPASGWSSTSSTDGRLHVVVAVSDVGALRGELSIAEYVDTNPAHANFNALRTGEPVVAFLTASNLPPETRGDRPELANVHAIVDGFSCFDPEDFGRNCRYISDEPGGEVAVELEPDAIPLEELEGLDAPAELDAVRAEIAASRRVAVDTDLVLPDQIDPAYEVVSSPGAG